MKHNSIEAFISLNIWIPLALVMAILITSICGCSHHHIGVNREMTGNKNNIPHIAIVDFINLHPLPEMQKVEKRLVGL